MTDRSCSIDLLVEQAATLGADDIPAEALARAGALFADTVACVLAGGSADGIPDLRETVLYWGGREQATVLGFGDRTSAPWAAFLNSAAGHARDYDDTHDAALNHGSVTVIPAALAVAEACSRADDSAPAAFRRGAVSGRELLAAAAVGLEVGNRLGMAFIPYLHPGWLPTTLWGPFACAAACGRLLRLDARRMRHAFGLAYSQIHGNRQALVDGALAKRIQPAWSASAGVQAAFMAANGISAARRIISGDFGIPALYTGGRFDAERLEGGLGSFEETLNISVKPYPSCRCTHPVIDAALEIQGQGAMAWDGIEKGMIYLPPSSMAQVGGRFRVRENPTVDAQFSAQYTAALAFIKGRPGIADFAAENVLSRRDVAELAGRFETQEFEKGSPALVPVVMEITLRSGEARSSRIGAARGSRENPMTEADLAAKFDDCLSNASQEYSAADRSSLLAAVRGLAEFDDVADVVAQGLCGRVA